MESLTTRLVQAKPHTITLDGGMIEPDEIKAIERYPGYLFRAMKAVPCGGVDYKAFVVKGAYVGTKKQYREPRPANDVFSKLRREMDYPCPPVTDAERHDFDTCAPDLSVSILVHNISDKSQFFAIQLEGKAVFPPAEWMPR